MGPVEPALPATPWQRILERYRAHQRGKPALPRPIRPFAELMTEMMEGVRRAGACCPFRASDGRDANAPACSECIERPEEDPKLHPR